MTVNTNSTLQLQGNITLTNSLFYSGSGTNNNGAIENISGSNTLSGTLKATTGSSRINSDSGTLTITTFDNGSFGPLVVGGAGNVILQNGMFINSNLQKDGTGTLTIQSGFGGNQGGLLSISNGAVALNAGVNLTANNGVTVFNGGTLQLFGGFNGGVGNNSYPALTLYGSGNNGSGALESTSGTNTWNSAINLSNSASITADAGSALNLTSSIGITGATYGLTLNGPGNIFISSGISTTTGSLTKNGTGTATLSGSNNFSGGVTLNAGTLNINNSYALGTGTFTIASNSTIDNTSAGSLTLSNSGSIQWLSTNSTFIGTQSLNLGSNAINFTTSSTITVVSNALTLGNLTNSTGIAITKAGAGTLVLAGTNNMGYGWIISAGALNLQNANAIGSKAKSSVIVNNGAALQLQGGLTYVSATGANASTTINGNGINTNGAIENVSGNNTYSKDIILGSDARINSDAGLLTLNSSTGIAGPGLGLTLGGAGNITVSSVIATTTGSLTKDGTGTVTLTTANTYSGGTILNAGTLAISNSAALGTGTLKFASNGTTLQALANLSITNPLTNSANGIINNGGFAFTNTGVISGGGGTLTFAGTGTTTISATNTYTGVTAITGGVTSLGNAGKLASTSAIVTNGATLLLSGAVNGGLATGTALSLNGNVSLNSTSGTRPSGVNAGNLTLTGTSSINFGATATGNTEFSFYTLTQNGNYLDIFNWKGSSTTPLFNNAGSGSYTTYSNILFYSGDTTASTFLGAGQSFAGSNQIVPVPEPAVFLTALLLLGILIYTHRALITRYLATFLGLCYSVFFIWK